MINQLINEKPLLNGGGTVYMGLPEDILKWIAKPVSEGRLSAETGCGASTCAFAIAGFNHVCISPFSVEHQAIVKWLNENNQKTSRIHFIAEMSQRLRASDIGNENSFDMFLIDGNHGFPAVFHDFNLADLLLKVGGFLIVDDCGIKVTSILIDYLKSEPTLWRHVYSSGNRTIIFHRLAVEDFRVWNLQPFNDGSQLYKTYPSYNLRAK